MLSFEPNDRLRIILQQRSMIVDQLRAASPASRGTQATMRKRMARYLERCRVDQWTDMDPDAASLLLPLMAVEDAGFLGNVDQAAKMQQIEAAVARWINDLPTNHRWQKALAAIAYPLVMLATTFALFVFASFFIIPVFERLFDSFELDLPWMTQGLITLSHRLPNALAIVAIAAGCVGIFAWLLRWRSLRTGSLDPISKWLRHRFGPSSAIAMVAKHWITVAKMPTMNNLTDQWTLLRPTVTNDRVRHWFDALTSDRKMTDGQVQWMGRRGGRLVPSVVDDASRVQQQAIWKSVAEMASDRRRRRHGLTSILLGEVMTVLVGISAGAIVVALFFPLVTLVQ